MKIPKKVKVGGKTYQVETTDHLSLGKVNVSAEIDYTDLTIRISPQAQQKMEADFMHELCHAIYAFLGYAEHDEKKIDELAQALYMVVQDNQEIFNVGE